MTAVIDMPAGVPVHWRHFNDSDNNRPSYLWRLTPEVAQMTNPTVRWAGTVGTFAPRSAAWSLTLQVLGPIEGQVASSLVTAYLPGPPTNWQGEYRDGAELAGMTSAAWLVRWEASWQGGGSIDYDDMYTYLWIDPGVVGVGWTVGHVGVFPPE